MNEQNVNENIANGAPPPPPPPPPQPQPSAMQAKADPVKRLIAFIIDSAIAMIVGVIPFIGALIGGAYMLLRDALPIEALEYKSVGKKIMKLSVVNASNPSVKIDYAMSAKRNWMFAMAPIILLLMFIPILGWILDIFIIIAVFIIGIIEAVKVFSDPKGIRMGDKMAGTMVIES